MEIFFRITAVIHKSENKLGLHKSEMNIGCTRIFIELFKKLAWNILNFQDFITNELTKTKAIAFQYSSRSIYQNRKRLTFLLVFHDFFGNFLLLFQKFYCDFKFGDDLFVRLLPVGSVQKCSKNWGKHFKKLSIFFLNIPVPSTIPGFTAICCPQNGLLVQHIPHRYLKS